MNTLDNAKPTSHVLPLAGIQTSPSFEVNWSGTDSGAGVLNYTIAVSEDGGPYTSWSEGAAGTSGTFTGQVGKAYAFYSVARDQAGNVESKVPVAEAITLLVADSTPPTTTATASPNPNTSGWNNISVTVTLSAVDNPGGSGVKQIQFSLAGASSGIRVVNASSATVPVSAEGITTLSYFASDKTGNQEASKRLTVKVDKTKPIITGNRSPAPNAAGWNNTNVIVSFGCADVGSGASGVATNTVAGQTLSSEGAGQSVTSTGSCVDNGGNAADPVSGGSINIDKTPPSITASASPTTLWPPDGKMVPVTITGMITDGVAGVNGSTATYAVVDEYGTVQPSGPVALGSNGSYVFTIPLQASRTENDQDGRRYTITVSAQDRAGNKGLAFAVVTVPHDQGK